MFAHVMVARKHDNGRFTIGAYLVDLLEVGLNDSLAMVNEPEEVLGDLLDGYDVDFVETDYEFVHNMVYGGKEFAEEMGARGDKEFSWTQYVLEEDTEDISLVPIPFGGEDFEEGDGGEDPERLAADLVLAMTDVAYSVTFGEDYMDAVFAEAREEADSDVVYNDMDREPVSYEEDQVYGPFLEIFENIEPSDKNSLKKLRKDLLDAIEKSPEVCQLYDVLVHVYLNMGEREMAYQLLHKIIQEFPDNYTARFFSVISLMELGKLDEADQLIWGAYDIKDLEDGDKLGEFNVCLFYSLRCKYFMAKGEFDKAEIYYILVRDIQSINSRLLSDLQVAILFDYSNYRRKRLEEHHGKGFMEIVEGMELMDGFE